MARWGRRRRSATGWARNPLAAPLRVCATCDALGESTRVTVPAISAVSDQLGLFACQTDYGGRKCGSTTEWGQSPIPGPSCARARCKRTEESVGVTDPEISTLPAQPNLVLYQVAYNRAKRRPVTGWARKSRLALFDARATPNEFGRTSRVADSQISRLSARPDLIPYWTGRRRKKCRPAVGRARNPVLGLPPVCTRCGRPGKSIRVTDPEISAL